MRNLKRKGGDHTVAFQHQPNSARHGVSFLLPRAAADETDSFAHVDSINRSPTVDFLCSALILLGTLVCQVDCLERSFHFTIKHAVYGARFHIDRVSFQVFQTMALGAARGVA